jgi:hypothetical protein
MSFIIDTQKFEAKLLQMAITERRINNIDWCTMPVASVMDMKATVILDIRAVLSNALFLVPVLFMMKGTSS